MLLLLLLLPRPSSPSCSTIGGDECVLPFRYQGRLYHACTGDDSDNGAPWCAVQVRRSGGQGQVMFRSIGGQEVMSCLCLREHTFKFWYEM